MAKTAKRIRRVGAFVDSLDPLMAKDALDGVELIFFAVKGSKEEAWAQQFLPENRCITFNVWRSEEDLASMEIEDFLRDSDLATVLKKSKIEAFILGTVSTPCAREWARRHGIRIIGAPYRFEHALGNKLRFDRFLKRHDLPSPRSHIFNWRHSRTIPWEGKSVLQIADSKRAEGTFFVDSLDDIRGLINAGIISATRNYLLREFVKGETFGITTFIAPGQIVLSALRRQCFVGDDGNRKVFAGIQWVPSSDLSRIARRRINDTFLRLGRLLYDLRYFGFANFDFQLDEQGYPYILECNPRLSSASTQLVKFPELSSGVQLGKLFLEGFFKSKAGYQNSPKVSTFPETTYEGSTLELVLAPGEKRPLIEVMREFPAGVYSTKERSVRFYCPDISQIKRHRGELIYYSDVKRGQRYVEHTRVAFVVANFPMFTKRGRINSYGERVRNRFRVAA